ncbi:MAG: penicillin-binding protein 2 [Thermoleophilia bacterium]
MKSGLGSFLNNKPRKKNERREPSIAIRVGVLGGMAVLLFAVLIFRIWFLQILSGDQYVAMAEDNRSRFVVDEAPRGIIFDRNKVPVVENRAGLAVTVFPPALKDPRKELTDLGKIIGMPYEDIQSKLDQHSEDTYSSVVVKKDITPDMKSYLIERIPLYFPGIDIKKLPLRSYPGGAEAAHVLGHVGQIDQAELAEPRYADYKAGDEIGKDGVEYQFDNWLKGKDGGQQVEVDAAGRPKRVLGSTSATPGDNVVLTIDSKVQKAAEDGLNYGINLAHTKNYPATGGSAIVMDPKTGEVLAMASAPSYDPKVWVGGMSDQDYQQLTSDNTGDPLLNRAIQGQYAPGSTFKVITSLAGLQEGMVTPLDTFNSTGAWTVPGDDTVVFHDWSALGVVDLHRAIVMSCDTYFYNVGYRFYQANNNQGMQKWARMMGLGTPTGIDLPGEASGRVPDPAWKQEMGQTEIDKMWLPGNSVNMAIGQGDMLATPLQMAQVYCGIANNGRIMKPHVGLKVEDPVTGEVIREWQPEVQTDLPISPQYMDDIRQALIGAAQSGSAIGDVFSGFQPQIAGKSGTAQVAGKTDYAWYAAYAPASDPKYVVVVQIEQGGGGSASAAPAVRKILEALYPQAAPPTPAQVAAQTNAPPSN